MLIPERTEMLISGLLKRSVEVDLATDERCQRPQTAPVQKTSLTDSETGPNAHAFQVHRYSLRQQHSSKHTSYTRQYIAAKSPRKDYLPVLVNLSNVPEEFQGKWIKSSLFQRLRSYPQCFRNRNNEPVCSKFASNNNPNGQKASKPLLFDE